MIVDGAAARALATFLIGNALTSAPATYLIQIGTAARAPAISPIGKGAVASALVTFLCVAGATARGPATSPIGSGALAAAPGMCMIVCGAAARALDGLPDWDWCSRPSVGHNYMLGRLLCPS